jgi:hypothetical protein
MWQPIQLPLFSLDFSNGFKSADVLAHATCCHLHRRGEQQNQYAG